MVDNTHTRRWTATPASDQGKALLKTRLHFERRMGKPVEGEMITLLFGPELLIGRDKACDIAIVDDRVSRKHALIRIDADAARLSDLGSTNGTYRNQEPVSEEIILQSGDLLNFGQAKTYETRIVERENIITSVRLASGREAFLLVPQEFIIGFAGPQAEDVDLRIYDPKILPHHARIEFFTGQVFLLAMESDHPVIVNSSPVREIELRNDYRIEIGDTLLRFERL